MTAAATSPAAFDTGRVVRQAFQTLKRRGLGLVPLALLLFGVPYAPVLTGAAGQARALAAAGVDASGFPGGPFGIWIGSYLVYLIGYSVAAATVMDVALADGRGRGGSFAGHLVAGLGIAPALFAVSVLKTVAISVGLVLLVIPGLFMIMTWMVTNPVLVAERRGVFKAFSRSAELTKGHWSPLFGLMVAYLLAGWMVSMAVRAIISPGDFTLLLRNDALLNAGWGPIVAEGVIQALLSLVMNVGLASIYGELRMIKDGLGADTVAAAFD